MSDFTQHIKPISLQMVLSSAIGGPLSCRV